jgi:hypothetical protein
VTSLTSRKGASSLGCLFTLLIVTAAVYFGVNIAEAYWRFYEYQDDMRSLARFSSNAVSDTIVAHLRASADSLGLPADAGRVIVRRTDARIILESDYYERVELPGYVRDIHFHPRAEGTR